MEALTATPNELDLRGPWVEVDLDQLGRNLQAIQAVLRPSSTLIFVIKSDAYGHGLAPIARCAAAHGVQWFAVAYPDEALAIRTALPEARILVMGVLQASEVPVAMQHNITPVIVSEDHGRALAAKAEQGGGVLSGHLKIDTGMGRLGVPWDEASEIFQRLLSLPGLCMEGVCSHFAAVEPDRPELAGLQMERFQGLDLLKTARLFRHVSSSRAFFFHEEWDFEGVRSGIAPFGYGTEGERMRVRTYPILQWRTRVIQVRSVPADFPVGYYGAYRTTGPTSIATIAAGYADGFNRLLSNTGHVLIRGYRRKVVGRISMNWVTVEVGKDTDVATGDEVVLIGSQGEASIWADEVARLCNTIPYEILTNIHSRAERRYL